MNNLQLQDMLYDPAFGTVNPVPSNAAAFRTYHGKIAWVYNPWSGKQRHPCDISRDINGEFIEPFKEKNEKNKNCF